MVEFIARRHLPLAISCFFLMSFCQLTFENKDVLIAGDDNTNLIDTDTTSYRTYTDCVTGFGFESLIDCPTRISSRESGELIDHVLSNISPSPCPGVVKSDETDNLPIFLTFSSEMQENDTSYFTSAFSADTFVEAISKTDWSPNYSMFDTEAALNESCYLFLLPILTNTRYF